MGIPEATLSAPGSGVRYIRGKDGVTSKGIFSRTHAKVPDRALASSIWSLQAWSLQATSAGAVASKADIGMLWPAISEMEWVGWTSPAWCYSLAGDS